MGDIGTPIRRIEVLPIEQPVLPVPEPAPAAPPAPAREPRPEPVKVPARQRMRGKASPLEVG